MEEQLYTSGQAAAALGISVSTLVDAEHHGYVVKQWQGSARRYTEADLDELKEIIPCLANPAMTRKNDDAKRQRPKHVELAAYIVQELEALADRIRAYYPEAEDNGS